MEQIYPFPKLLPSQHGPASFDFNYIDVLKGENIPNVLVELLEIKPMTGYALLCTETYANLWWLTERGKKHNRKIMFRLENGELVDVEKLKVVDMLMLCRAHWREFFPNNVLYIASFVENAKMFETHRSYVDEMTIDQPEKHLEDKKEIKEEQIKPSFCCRFFYQLWKKVKQS